MGVSHPHVAKVRKALEKSGDVETITTSIDSKGRKQPARKPTALKVAATAPGCCETQAVAQNAGETTSSGADRLREERENEIQRLQKENLGLRSEIEELRAETTTPAADLTPLQLQAEIEKLGLFRFRQEVLPELPWVSLLTDIALSLATAEQLVEAIGRKIPPTNKSAHRILKELKKATEQPPPATEEECIKGVLH